MSTDNSQKPQTQAQVYRERQMESLRRTLGDDILGFLNDPAIIEIMLNQDGRIWVDVLGGDMEPRSAMDPVRAKMVIETVASMLDTSITKENPIISGELPLDGSRFEAQIPPIVEAPTFAIRKKALLVFTLDDYVAKGIMTERQRDLIIDAVRERKNILVSGGTGCHAKGTEIMMADGSLKKVEDIRVGDQVMGPDSSPRNVLRLHRGIDKLYRVAPNNGDAFVVNGGHILALESGPTHNRDRKMLFSTVRDAIEKMDRRNKCYNTTRPYWLKRVSIDFQKQHAALSVDPYFLGALLGDGCFIGSVQITKSDEAIVNEAYSQAANYGLNIKRTTHWKNGCHSYFFTQNREKSRKGGNPLLNQIRELGLLNKRGWDKFIPSAYKTASRTDRLALLAGLLDTDGGYDKKGAFSYATASKALADDVAFLARSLGYCVTISKRVRKTSQTHDIYFLSISGELDAIPTRIPRKQATTRKRNRSVLHSGFTIEPSGIGAYYGFELDKDHLYIDGQFTVHHNSGKTTLLNAVINIASQVSPQHRFVIIQDVLEIQCTAPNVVSFRTSDEIDMTRLLKSTMRMRPDRIIVGEVRGKEALDLLKAWNTGHPGGIGTVHANDARAALVRIGMLVQEANVPPNPELIAEAVNVVVSIKRTSTGRIVDEVLAVKGFENGRFLTESL